MKTIGIGVIGWGFMGRTHTHALLSIPLFYPGIDFQVRLVCVCARHIEHARAAVAEAGFERCTDDYRALLAMEDIDVVSICTPNDQHEAMAIAALRAGKHVYIDKPLAVDAASAERIAAVAAESGVFTRMVFNYRYYPSTIRAKQLVEAGAIGPVMGFSARYLHSGSIDPEKPVGWKQLSQGGVMLDLASHALDLITWLTGYPERVLCAMRQLYDERPTPGGGRTRALSEDHVLAMLQLPGGALGTLEASKIATGSNDELILELRGAKGAILWNSMAADFVDFFDNTLPEAVYGGARGFTRIESVQRYPAPGGKFLPPKNTIGWDRAHLHCYYTFLDAVSRGQRPENGIEDGARLQRLMEKLRESSASNGWVEI